MEGKRCFKKTNDVHERAKGSHERAKDSHERAKGGLEKTNGLWKEDRDKRDNSLIVRL